VFTITARCRPLTRGAFLSFSWLLLAISNPWVASCPRYVIGKDPSSIQVAVDKALVEVCKAKENLDILIELRL